MQAVQDAIAVAVEAAAGLSRSTEELDLLLRRAAWIGRGDRPMVSFTSLFLAFFASEDDVSLWVQDKAAWIGPSLADVVAQWKRRGGLPEGLDEKRVRAARRLDPDRLPQEFAATESAHQVLAMAREIRDRVDRESPADVRHVWAVYVYLLIRHEDDLRGWKFDREAWATRFRCHVTEAYPGEAAAWRGLHDEIFPRHFSVGIEGATRWGTLLARRRSPAATSLDTRAVLGGVLCDGLRHADGDYASSLLVVHLGGVDAVRAIVAGEGLQAADDRRALGTAVLSLGDEVQAVLDRARVFACAAPPADEASGRSPLHVRHVLAALLTERRPMSAFDLIRRAGRTPEGLLAQLRSWLGRQVESNDDLGAWDRIREELRDDVVAGYDNDEATGEDRLHISADVRALAAVLASTQVKPPVSVGLFGDWGSGKSFFMGKLRERIAQLADAAASKRGGSSWFCGRRGRVVQIDFNAWHYMDADLWSSLAARVFDALCGEFEAEFARACVEGLASLHEDQRQLQVERDRLASRQGELDVELAREADRRETRKLELEDYFESVGKQVVQEVARIPEVIELRKELHLQGEVSRTELERAARELASIHGRLRRWWSALVGSPVRVLLLTASVLAIPLVLPILASLAARVLTGAVAVLAALTTVLRAWPRGGIAKIRAALVRIDAIEADARARKSREERRFELERDQIAARIAEVEREQRELARRKAELEAKLASLADGRTLAEFVRERASSDDYRKKLGVVSAVHQDFRQLVKFLAPGAQGPDVERIVLYIDDLDRCSPAKVVEVLQAVHVILSLPLFVVVVAVDSRWLLDSLTAYYRQQFPGDPSMADAARPQQYLEKIFQIPYTLPPMSAAGYGALVGGLLGPHVDPAAEEPGERPSGQAAIADLGVTAPGAPSAIRAAAAPPRRVSVNLTPRSLRLEPGEVENMAGLSALIPSPRGAKRLVNLYRIVRASLDDEALDALVGGGYRILQICLALVVGHPALGAALFEEILANRLHSRGELATWCGERPAGGAKEAAAIRVLSSWNDQFADWNAVRDAVRRVARFSLETGRVLGHY